MKKLMTVICLLAAAIASAEEWTEDKVRALERRAMEAVADLALVPPRHRSRKSTWRRTRCGQ